MTFAQFPGGVTLFLAFAAVPLAYAAPTHLAGGRGLELFLVAGGASIALIGIVAFIQGRRAVRAPGDRW